MNNLIIDCSAGMSVYVLVDDKIYCDVDYDQKKHSDDLICVIDKLLKDAEVDVKSIDNIFVCVGPGSFTGIRVAISVCKGLSIGANAKIYTISNFDIFENDDAKNKIIVLEGFAKFLYVRKDYNGDRIEECISVEDFVQDIKQCNYDIYAQNKKVQNILKKYEINSIIAQNNIISCVFNKIAKNDYIESNQISPIYLRASQAEMERNRKLSRGD